MKHELEAKDGLLMDDHTEMARKRIISKNHLTSARLFAGFAAEVEAKDSLSKADEHAHRAYATGAIVLSVAFLEASINELFLDAVDRNKTSLASMTEQQMALLGRLWDYIGNRRLLDKYEIVLKECGGRLFEKKAELLKDVELLIDMRNSLVHYQPEWDGKRKHRSLEDRAANRFQLNPHAAPSLLWFPDRCLGAGCAKWATERAEMFMEDFCRRLKLPSRLPRN